MLEEHRSLLVSAIRDGRAVLAAVSVVSVPGMITENILPEGCSAVFPKRGEGEMYLEDGTLNSDRFYMLPLGSMFSDFEKFTTLQNVQIMLVGAAIMRVGDVYARLKRPIKSVEWNFLTHIRNAVAHGNVFNIVTPLKESAEFQGYRIDMSLNGKVLFGDVINPGWLLVGDALLLLDNLEESLQHRGRNLAGS